MKPISKLGVGPMSPEIIEAVYKYSEENSEPLMLIASKNQIDWNGGYVNNWTTADFVQYCNELKNKYQEAKVYLCRDHCGPGFNGNFDLKDVYATLDADIENGFDLIHIDFCHFQGDENTKLEESKKAIEYIQKKSPKMMIEIGTDENTGENIEDLDKIEKNMSFFNSFSKPHFFVCQTGTVIKEINQRGILNEQYVRKLKNLADKYNLNIKEHNADYQPKSEIQKRKNLVGALNVAPQYGTIQTLTTINKAISYGIDINEFVNKAYESKKWEKWIDKNNPQNKMLCSIIAGHYNFNSEEYKNLVKKIEEHEDLKESIIIEIMNNINLYIKNL